MVRETGRGDAAATTGIFRGRPRRRDFGAAAGSQARLLVDLLELVHDPLRRPVRQVVVDAADELRRQRERVAAVELLDFQRGRSRPHEGKRHAAVLDVRRKRDGPRVRAARLRGNGSRRRRGDDLDIPQTGRSLPAGPAPRAPARACRAAKNDDLLHAERLDVPSRRRRRVGHFEVHLRARSDSERRRPFCGVGRLGLSS